MDIAFMADKGGVGKSTLVMHVATRLRQIGIDAAIMDLDGTGTCRLWQREPYVPVYGLDDLGEDPPQHAVRLWDTPAHPGAAMRDALVRQSQAIVVVAQTDPASQRAAASLYVDLTQDHDCVRLLLNEVSPTGREGELALAQAREGGVVCINTPIRKYRCYEHAAWDGRAVCDWPYPSADKAWADISALTEELLRLEVTDAVA